MEGGEHRAWSDGVRGSANCKLRIDHNNESEGRGAHIAFAGGPLRVRRMGRAALRTARSAAKGTYRQLKAPKGTKNKDVSLHCNSSTCSRAAKNWTGAQPSQGLNRGIRELRGKTESGAVLFRVIRVLRGSLFYPLSCGLAARCSFASLRLLFPLRFLRYLLFTFSAFLVPQQLHAQSGMLDTNTFNPGTGVDIAVYSIAIQANGQILIGGDFSSYNDVERIAVARLNANGSRDDSYNPGSALSGSFPSVYSVALQSSGKVLLGGNFTTTSGTNLARININGNLDVPFVAGTDTNGTISAVSVQTNDSILLGGSFTQVNGAPRSSVARLSASGIVDSGFNPSLAGGFSEILTMALQGDGKILIGGSFTNVNTSARTNIARLNSDGSLDTNFKPISVNGGTYAPAIPGLVNALALDGQGRVLVGGDFVTLNGQVRTNLARLNPDGSLDGTFNPAAGTDYPVTSLAIQRDGKILLGGYFNTVNGVTNNFIARLSSDGILDATFNTGSGASDVVYAVALQPDDKVLIGGAFTEFNGTGNAGIARLQNFIPISPPQLLNPFFSNNVFRVSVATFAGKNYTLEYKNAFTDATWTALPSVGGDGTVKTLTDSSATVPRRFYRVDVQ